MDETLEPFGTLPPTADGGIPAAGTSPGTASDDPEDDLGEDDFENLTTIRAKWSLDGATTLAEAAAKARALADHLDGLHAAGWTLAGPFADDYGHARPPAGRAGPDETPG